MSLHCVPARLAAPVSSRVTGPLYEPDPTFPLIWEFS